MWIYITAVVLDENNTISSALAVFHELDHAARFAQDPNGYVADVNTDNETYGNVEEKRVIEETENVKASQLNEPIRNNHSYHDIVEIDDVRYHKTNGVEYYK